MTRKQETAVNWLRLIAPLAFFLFSLAVWGGRLENRLDNEIDLRQKDYNSVEYIRRQNTAILERISAQDESLEWIKRELMRCGD